MIIYHVYASTFRSDYVHLAYCTKHNTAKRVVNSQIEEIEEEWGGVTVTTERSVNKEVFKVTPEGLHTTTITIETVYVRED